MPMSPFVAGLRAKVGADLLLLPSVATALFDDAGRLLLAEEAGTGRWMTVGGGIDPGESPADAAVREMFEETGLWAEPVRVLGVFGGPDYRVSYPNGDESEYVVTLFEMRRLGGEARPDGEETLRLRFVDKAEAGRLPMSTLSRLLVRAAFGRPEEPAFTAATWRPPL